MWWLALAREPDVLPLGAVPAALEALVVLADEVDARLRPTGGLEATLALLAQLDVALAAIDAGEVHAARQAVGALQDRLAALARELATLRALRRDVGD